MAKKESLSVIQRGLTIVLALCLVLVGVFTLGSANAIRNQAANSAQQPNAINATPSVVDTTPADGATAVRRDIFIAGNLYLPNSGGGVDASTMNIYSVRLIRVADDFIIPASLTTSGGGDVLILNPLEILDPYTKYRFEVTGNLKDLTGASFANYTMTFTTGSAGGPTPSGNIEFDKQAVGIRQPMGEGYSAVSIGPDNKLYAATIKGRILRYDINTVDGTLTNPYTITTVRTYAGGDLDRMIVGFVFDKNASAGNLSAWITHSPYALSQGPDWTGKITKLSGANLQNAQDFVVRLPRSSKDHLSNSLVYGSDNALYMTQGSNSAMGAPDNAWANRNEHLLTGAVLRIDPALISSPPLDVRTEKDPSNPSFAPYDPFAPNAPVSLFATGVRNAYDLVWHSNGQLYVPTNGSAAGGSTPATPADIANTPACQNNRIDKAVNGPYTDPAIPALTSTSSTNRIADQADFIFRVVKGGYYGHPNPTRCEWVMNGGNPTTGEDPAEVAPSVVGSVNYLGYPVGTNPDRNYRGFSWNFGLHYSPNGVIEYKSNSFNGLLKGKLIVARYAGGKDLAVMTIGGSKEVVDITTNIPGMKGFAGPLDLVEYTASGTLQGAIYMSDYEDELLYLLKPVNRPIPKISVSPPRNIYNVYRGGTAVTKSFTIKNNGDANLKISGISIVGVDAAFFSRAGISIPTTLTPNQSISFQVTMNVSSSSPLGPKGAIVRINSDDPFTPVAEGALRGLVANGTGDTNEPSLQWILDTYEIPVSVGDDDPTTNKIHSANANAPLLGQEIPVSFFTKPLSGPITIEPLAVFGPYTASGTVLDFGWYPAGNTSTLNSLFSVPNSDFQKLAPTTNGSLSFDPGYDFFGFYSKWPFFSDRLIFSEDGLNTTGSFKHHVRVYPVRDNTGNTIDNTYILAFEEETSANDYQDVVVLVRNILPVNLPNYATYRINFQPDMLQAPTGYWRDYGDGFGLRTWPLQGDGKYIYGWVVPNTHQPLFLNAGNGNGRKRDIRTDDLRYDTLMHMQADDIPGFGDNPYEGVWEMVLPNGEYKVTVAVGDPSATNSFHSINVESVNLINRFVPSGDNGSLSRHMTANGRFTVSDNRLTVDAFGGTNTKINFIDIEPWNPVSATQTVVAQTATAVSGQTQTAVVQTQTVVAGQTQTAVVGQTQTAVANQTATVVTGQTQTAVVNQTATALANQTQTAIAGQTQTAVANQTATVVTGQTQTAAATQTAVANQTATVITNQTPTTTPNNNYKIFLPLITRGETGNRGGMSNPALSKGRQRPIITSPETLVRNEGDQSSTTKVWWEAVTDQAQVLRAAEVVAAQCAGNGNIEVENLESRNIPYNDRMVFSKIQNPQTNFPTNYNWSRSTGILRVRNTGVGPLKIDNLDFVGTWALSSHLTLPTTIPAGSFLDVGIRFTANTGPGSPGGGQVYNGTLTINSNDANEPAKVIELSGWWQLENEKDNEPDMQEIMDIFGYDVKTTYAGQNLNNAGRPEAMGEEILSAYWTKADPSKGVRIVQLAALHQCCQDFKASGIAWYEKGKNQTKLGEYTHEPAGGQSLLPRNYSGSRLFDETATITPTIFQFNVGGSAWGDDSLNPPKSGLIQHYLRSWPARDRDGLVIPNTYIFSMDFVGINYDYNDNVYIISNIRPEVISVDQTMPGKAPGVPGLTLNFAQALTGTISDTAGLGTGFLSVQRNDADSVKPTPGGSLDRTKLNLNTSNGTLSVQSTSGTNDGTTDTQVNALLLPFFGQSSKFIVSATINAPLGITSSNQQAGVVIGPEKDNFIKAVVTSNGSQPVVQLVSETDGNTSTVNTSPAIGGTINSIEVMLFGDPRAGTIRAGYKVNGGAVTMLGDGVTLTGGRYNRFFDRVSEAGIITTNKSSGSFTAVFDRFAILSDETADNRPTLWRIDVGSASSFTDGNGKVWQADTGLFTPANTPPETTGTVPIDNTVDDTIYQTYRGQVSGGDKTLTYNLSIPSTVQKVDLRLHFAELYWGAPGGGAAGPGKRVFDVKANGVTILNDFDITAAVGGARTALIVPIDGIPITNGQLQLSFTSVLDNSSIAGIEVFASTVNNNVPPAINAGFDQQVPRNASVTLTGTASDYEGSSLTTAWTQISGPTVTLNGSGNTRTFTAPNSDATLVFEFRATDGAGNISTDTVTIVVGETAISDFAVTSTSPSSPNDAVTFLATVACGSNITYEWNFGDGTPVVTETTGKVRHSYTTVGTYTVNVTARNGVSNLSTSLTVRILPLFTRIDSGSYNTVTTPDGITWVSDRSFVNGFYGNNSQIGDISGTDNDLIYYTERYATTTDQTGAKILNYAIPVPQNGTYTVKLHFAETFFNAVPGVTGYRKFNVDVEGGRKLTNFDPAKPFGSKVAQAFTYDVTVNDGVLSIDLVGVEGKDPIINAIEVFGSAGSTFPTATTGPTQPPTSSPNANATSTAIANQTATAVANQTATSVAATSTAVANQTATSVAATSTAIANQTATSVAATSTAIANQTATSVAATSTAIANQTATAAAITSTATSTTTPPLDQKIFLPLVLK